MTNESHAPDAVIRMDGVTRRFNGMVAVHRLVVHPVILGSGTPFFPPRKRPIGLRLVESRTFGSGVTYLGYAAR